MRRVASSWKVIEEVLKQNAHASYRALRPPVTKYALRRLQKHFDVPLPTDYLASLAVHDGLRDPESLFDYMTLLPVQKVIHWSGVARSVQIMGEFTGDETDRRGVVKTEWRWRDAWVPIMADAGGNLMVLDLDPAKKGKRGQVLRWRNSDSRIDVVSRSFAEWLDCAAEELRNRRFSLSPYGDIELKRRLT